MGFPKEAGFYWVQWAARREEKWFIVYLENALSGWYAWGTGWDVEIKPEELTGWTGPLKPPE